MIGLDTNVLARYFVAEAGADPATETQRQAARQLIESGQPLFLPKTVALELEWVLRGYYGFAAAQVLAVFDLLLGHPTLTLEDRPALRVGFRRCPPSRQLQGQGGGVHRLAALVDGKQNGVEHGAGGRHLCPSA